MSVGVRSEFQGVVLDLDWKQYKKANVAVVGATSNEDKTTSIWANIAYTWDNLTPFVNFINDKYENAAVPTSAFKRNALSVGLMIKPIKDVNFRYHVSYTNDVKEIDGATSATADKKVTANQIAAGIKFDI
jgi:predicted porin